MSDLINRSEAVQRLIQETVDSKNNLIHINTAKRLLQDVDTAYDVDNIVKELKKEKNKVTQLVEQSNEAGDFAMAEIYSQLASEYTTAIEIVKQGGVSDDVCQWQSVSDGEFIQNPHTKRLYSNEPSMKNIYCNTCGKKIKVVE